MEHLEMDLEWARETLGYVPSKEELEEFKAEWNDYIDSLEFEQDNPLYMV